MATDHGGADVPRQPGGPPGGQPGPPPPAAPLPHPHQADDPPAQAAVPAPPPEAHGPAEEAPPFSPSPPAWADPGRDYRPRGLPLEHEGFARQVETEVLTGARWADRLQSRIAPVAFAYATFKKYADDEGSRLAALMAYYTFLSLFPLTIGGVALLNRVLGDDPQAIARLIREVLPQEYQEQVLAAYTALPASGTALWVALAGLLLAGTGGVFALYATVNQVFAVPYRHRYGFGPRYARVVVVVFLMAVAVLVASIGGSVVGAVIDVPTINRVAVFLLSAMLFSAALYRAVRILSRRVLAPRELLLGAVLGGLAVSSVASLGSLLVGFFVANSAPVYGAFASVVAIISVMILAANGVVVGLEISVVRAWQLWPRGIDIHLLYPADERAYALLSLMDERMPSQRNDVRFDAAGHFDPRRPTFDTLDRRQPGIPRTPFDPD